MMKLGFGIISGNNKVVEKFKDYFVSYRNRYQRGWGLVGDFIKQPAVAITGLSYWFTKLGITDKWVFLLVPVWFLTWYLVGYFDQFVFKIWQRDAQWSARNIDPFQKEMLERVKNIEKQVAIIGDRQRKA